MKKHSAKVILNQPIQDAENDWIGVSTYVDKLGDAIDCGARLVAVTSDFGTGKSSLLSLYRKKNHGKREKGSFPYLGRKKIVHTINMWEHLDGESISVRDMHKNFVYHMVNQLSATKGSYLSKRLSKNYGLISVQSSSIWRSLAVCLAVLAFAVGEAFRRFSTELQELLDITEQQAEIGTYAGYLLGIILCGIVLWKADFIFSSPKSEGQRELDETVLIDYYIQEVLLRCYNRHYIFVIEDLDRTENKEVVIDFLKELRKFYLTDDNQRIKVHNNRITFVVCIKPEALLTGNETIANLYPKFFDYILNLQPINMDNYDAILNGLLYEIRDTLVLLGLAADTDHVSIDDIVGMQWMIRGRNIGIRQIKIRVNLAITLYESLDQKFHEKGISFEKCAVVSYLMTEYEKDFYELQDHTIDELIESHAEGELGQQFLADPFRRELADLIISKHIDANYRTYFYNYPKDSKLYDNNETLVFNSLVYNETPKNKEEYRTLLSGVGEDAIKDAFDKLDKLKMRFPIFTIEYDRLFLVMANQYRDRLLQIIANLPFDNKNLARTQEQLRICVRKREQLIDREGLLKQIEDTLLAMVNDKSILCALRETLCHDIPADILSFKRLFEGDNPFISANEVRAVGNTAIVMQLVNYDSMSEDMDACMTIHQFLIQEAEAETAYTDFYLQLCKQHGIANGVKPLMEYCERFDCIPSKLVDILEEAIKESIITAKDYVDLLEKLSAPQNAEIELLAHISWTKGLSEKLSRLLYEAEHYVDYVANVALNDEENLSYTDKNLIDAICEGGVWLQKNAAASWGKIRLGILRRGNLLSHYLPIYQKPFDFLTEQEINAVEDYREVIMILEKWELEEENLQLIADYFNKKFRNPTETYNIIKFITAQPSTISYQLFYLLDKKKLPYSKMSKARRDELTPLLVELFELKSSTEETLRFLQTTGIAIPSVEKDLYQELNEDSKLREQYVRFANGLDVVNPTTMKNIVNLDTISAYSDCINEKLFEIKQYRAYVVSKTLGKEKFEIEEARKDVLWGVYADLFCAENFKRTRKHMNANTAFVNELVDRQEYKKEAGRLPYYGRARQTKELLEYAFATLEDAELISYLSEGGGFRDYDSAHRFLELLSDRTAIRTSDKVYQNCYGLLLNGGLCGWYTKLKKKG